MVPVDFGAEDVAAQVFVGDLEALVLEPGDFHHLGRVLRLRAGEAVRASDGRGGWRACRWAARDVLEPDGPVSRQQRVAPEVTVGFSLVKRDRPEWIVQKLTELGVDVIIPLAAQRCVVRWEGERGGRHLDRLRVVAREAAAQSRRVWLPSVEPLATPRDVLVRPDVVLADQDGGPVSLDTPAVLVGPEGGWSPEELAAGATRVGLGSQVLRAETAAVTAGALLTALRAGLVAEVRPDTAD